MVLGRLRAVRYDWRAYGPGFWERGVTVLPMLITTDGCAESLRARTWLVEHGIVFAEYSLTREPDLAAAAVGLRVTAAPLLVAARGAVFGYQPAAYGDCLDQAVDPPAAAPLRRVAT